MINQKNKYKDRIGCFGASDTAFIMGNWNTATFLNWWQTKLGTMQNGFENIYTITGTHKEHQIAKWYADKTKQKLKLDRKIKLKKYSLVVNLDSETKDCIIEIKTFKLSDKKWTMPKKYWQQVQVQMFASKKHNAIILAYGLKEEDYNNFYLEIDKDRVLEIPIEYDKKWIQSEYLPRVIYLQSCLKARKTPKIEELKGA